MTQTKDLLDVLNFQTEEENDLIGDVQEAFHGLTVSPKGSEHPRDFLLRLSKANHAFTRWVHTIKSCTPTPEQEAQAFAAADEAKMLLRAIIQAAAQIQHQVSHAGATSMYPSGQDVDMDGSASVIQSSVLRLIRLFPSIRQASTSSLPTDGWAQPYPLNQPIRPNHTRTRATASGAIPERNPFNHNHDPPASHPSTTPDNTTTQPEQDQNYRQVFDRIDATGDTRAIAGDMLRDTEALAVSRQNSLLGNRYKQINIGDRSQMVLGDVVGYEDPFGLMSPSPVTSTSIERTQSDSVVAGKPQGRSKSISQRFKSLAVSNRKRSAGHDT